MNEKEQRRLQVLNALDGGRLRMAVASALRRHHALLGRPVATSGWLVHKTGLTPAMVNKSLEHLLRLGIVRELTARKRNRVFAYQRCLDILNRGTGLP